MADRNGPNLRQTSASTAGQLAATQQPASSSARRHQEISSSDSPPRREEPAPFEDSAAPGYILRLARMTQRLTIAQIASATRIQTTYLEAIEDDDYTSLPSPLHARAFLRGYARYLELPDSEALVAWYDRERSPRSQQPVVGTKKRYRRFSWRWPAGFFTILGLTFLLLIILVGPPHWLPSNVQELRGSSPKPISTPAIPEGKLRGFALGGIRPQNDPTISKSSTVGTGVVVRIEASEGVWIRVVVDGQLAQEGLLATGERAQWSGNQSIYIRSGNARALWIVVNGRYLGPLGTHDGVIERTFGPETTD